MYALLSMIQSTRAPLVGLVLFGLVVVVVIGLCIWLTLTEPEET